MRKWSEVVSHYFSKILDNNFQPYQNTLIYVPINIANTNTPEIHITHMNTISKTLSRPGFGFFPMETADFSPM